MVLNLLGCCETITLYSENNRQCASATIILFRLRFTEVSCKQCFSVAVLSRVLRWLNVVSRSCELIESKDASNWKSKPEGKRSFNAHPVFSYWTIVRRLSFAAKKIKTDRRDCKHLVGDQKGGSRLTNLCLTVYLWQSVYYSTVRSIFSLDAWFSFMMYRGKTRVSKESLVHADVKGFLSSRGHPRSLFVCSII